MDLFSRMLKHLDFLDGLIFANQIFENFGPTAQFKPKYNFAENSGAVTLDPSEGYGICKCFA